MTIAQKYHVQIQYRGPLIVDCVISGEQKSDHVIPAHPGSGSLQVATDRWINFYATLDLRGGDSNRSIIYQIRSNSPIGPVIKEGSIAQCQDDWDPLQRGDRLFKSCGMPIAFGMPRGMTCQGKPLPNANVFVVKWYRWAQLPVGRYLVPANHRTQDQWPGGLWYRDRTLRVEWVQFRLSDDGNDIHLLTTPATLCQRGYEEDNDEICSLQRNLFMNHSMKAPVPLDDNGETWVEYDTFGHYGNQRTEHGGIAAVQYQFNRRIGLYEWTQTGPLHRLEGRIIGETCLNRVKNDCILSARSFSPDGATCWYRIDDPLKPLDPPALAPNTQTPRTAFACNDGALRLFSNPGSSQDGNVTRSPLACWTVDIDSFTYNDCQTIVDARKAKLPFSIPLLDMCKLCPSPDQRQIVFFRAITRQQTAPHAGGSSVTAAEHQAAGIHYAEFVFESR